MAYVKKTWVDYPSEDTPIEANDLNHMEQGIYDNDINKLDVSLIKNEKTNSNDAVYCCNYINEELGDTGWVNIPLSSGTADIHRCRRIGKIVYIEIINWKDYTINSVGAILPVGYAPQCGFRCISPTTGTNHVRFEVVNAEGKIGNDTATSGVARAVVPFHNTSGNPAWTDLLVSYVGEESNE